MRSAAASQRKANEEDQGQDDEKSADRCREEPLAAGRKQARLMKSTSTSAL
jgi:hypothetical protein